MKFQIYAGKINKPGKEKCGDAFIISHFENEKLLFLMVADGVSSTPCDWLASKTACEVVAKLFSENPDILNLKKYVEKAHQSVRQAQKECAGMLTSLSLLILETETNQIYFTNVGDSAILIGTETEIEQITTDDVTSILVKRNGQTLLLNGVPVFARGVTRSLGQTEPLEIEIKSRKINRNEIIVLVSDGITKDYAFNSKLCSILSQGLWEKELEEFVKNCAQKNDDDATLIVCRRQNLNYENRAVYQRCIKQNLDFRNENLSVGEVIKFLQDDLIEKLSQDSNAEVEKLLDYADQSKIKFNRTFLIELNHLIYKQGTDRQLWLRMQNSIRISAD